MSLGRTTDYDMITNHLIITPQWAVIPLEEADRIPHPVVLCTTIHISSDIVQGLFQALLPDEQQRALRFRQTEDRLRFIIGRALLRRLLSSYTHKELENTPFQHNAYGKPGLAPHFNAPQFNLAHAGDYVVIGLDAHPIGIDIEYLNPHFDFNTVLPANFSAEEIRYIQDASSPYCNFYLLWTRKEAFLKHIGYGLAQSPIHVPALQGTHPLLHRFGTNERAKYHYHSHSCYLTNSNHLLSVCLNNSDGRTPAFYEIQLA